MSVHFDQTKPGIYYFTPGTQFGCARCYVLLDICVHASGDVQLP
jgi:hypothetical protein